MYFVKQLSDNKALNEFVIKMNQSFKGRSTKNIPYQPIDENDVKREPGMVVGAYDDFDVLVGGVCIEFMTYHNLSAARIHHVWTDINFQKKGIAFQLMEEAEAICKLSGCEIMVLNVANIYAPAVNLYKKVGFEEYKVIANFPKTFYLIQMIKQINGIKIGSCKRKMHWIKSKIKFKILYKEDSSPTLLNKIYFNYFFK